MKKTKISITIDEGTLRDIDGIVDNIYIRNRSQAIEHLVKNSLGENKTAVILLGGPEKNLDLGGGLYCATGVLSGKTVVEHAIETLRKHNFKTIFVVARHKLLTKVFEIVKDGSAYGVKIEYVEEKASKGNADSLRHLNGKIDGTFLVVYGDIVFSSINLDPIWNDHLRHESTATIMLTTSSKPKEKGTVTVEGNTVLAFEQKPKISDVYLVFSPVFVAEPSLFQYSGPSLERDVFPELASKGLLNSHLSSEKEKHVHSKADLKE